MKLRIMLTVPVTLLVVGTASAGVRLTANVPEGGIREEYANGGVFSVEFRWAQDADTPLFGSEFGVAVASEALRIHSVAFYPAFSTALGQDTSSAHDVSSNGEVEAACVQPLGAIDRSLGADGAP